MMDPKKPLLEVRDLHSVFPSNGRLVRAVNDVSFTLSEGQILGVVGESGCGKSMLLLSLLCLIRYPGRVESGEVLFRGKDILALSDRQMRELRGKEISMIFQDPLSTLNPAFTVGEQIRESLRLHNIVSNNKLPWPFDGVRRAQEKERVLQIMNEVGIPSPMDRYASYPHQFSGGMQQRTLIAIALACSPALLLADEPTTALDVTIQAQILNLMKRINPRKTVREIISTPLRQRGLHNPHALEQKTLDLMQRVALSKGQIDRYPHQFSGGQRQRIGIARALAMQPQFIVADEPVSSLDVSIQAQVINLLEELQDEFHLTYLFISHDLSVVNHISDRVSAMYLGHIVEAGATDDLFTRPLHPYTQALLAAIPRVRKSQRKEQIILSGSVPSPIDPPSGCPFHPRCFAKVGKICETTYPPFFEVDDQKVACWIYDDDRLEK